MKELGSPFGIIISDKIIEEEKIDNIKYILRLKNSLIIFVVIIVDFIILFDFIKFELLQLFIKLKNMYILISILFLCFLITPNIIYRIFYKNFDHTNYENRTLASKPILVLTNINEYPKKYEEYFNDYLPFRNELVRLKNLNDIFIFKNSLYHKVLVGKERWLFYTVYNLTEKYIGIEEYNFTEKELEKAKNNLIHFRDELKKKNIDFIFMVCPDKQSIYFEYMPDYIKRKSIKNDTDIFVEYIKNNTDIKVVYPKEELLKYKDKYQLYYKYDNHWNNLGAYIGYSELMKSLNIYVDNIDNVNIKSLSANERFNFDIYHYNDLANLLGLSKIKYYNNDKAYIISNYITKNYYVKDGFLYNSKAYSNENNIMMIKDSFSLNMIDYIATEFKQSEFILTYSFRNEDILKYKPDIVVFETVERVLKQICLYKIKEINNDLED